ncbi:hypothetical protein [Sulfobacillus thermosulfidooxidans]|uniref:hypothetical protein n=1 Tax=Sulfobacillus thermosulfidooxidans TaxID=28034 RepID=UPI0006B4FF68|nr:hypothetical protein [Sulfobacillus thermosulfidooxidans]
MVQKTQWHRIAHTGRRVLLTLASTGLLVSITGAGRPPAVSNLVAHGPNGPQKPGTTLTYTATANGNGGTVEYQWWEEFPSGWKMVQNYSPNNTFTIADAPAGSYPVVVYALDANQIAAGDWAQAQYQQFIANVASTVTLQGPFTPLPTKTPQPLSAPVNADVVTQHSITFTAHAQNLLNPVYQFWYETPSGHWVGTNYSTQNTFTLTPTQSGLYRVVVYAKDPSAPNNATFAVWSSTLTGQAVAQTTGSPVPLSQLPSSVASVAPQPEVNALPPAPYVNIYSVSQNGQEISPTNPMQANVPVIIKANPLTENLNSNEMSAAVSTSSLGTSYPQKSVLFWVKASPTAPWALLPATLGTDQATWLAPPGSEWAIAATVVWTAPLSPNITTSTQLLTDYTGPMVLGGQQIVTTSSWDRTRADLQGFVPRGYPVSSMHQGPLQYLVLKPYGGQYATEEVWTDGMRYITSAQSAREVFGHLGLPASSVSGTSTITQANSSLSSTIVNQVVAVAQQDLQTYLNNPLKAAWQLPPAVSQADLVALIADQHATPFGTWRYSDAIAIQPSVTIPTTVSHLSQTVTAHVSAQQNAQGLWTITVPFQVSSQGAQYVNGKIQAPSTFPTIPGAITLQQVPFVGGPNGVAWTVDQFVY